MSNPNQLYLLADHIKLSLLERQRASSLHIDNAANDDGANPQDSHISRSLDQFREGVASLEEQQGKDGSDASITDALPSLQKQLDDLTSQFHGFSSPRVTATLTSPNDDSLASDFAHATSTTKPAKTVRFSDTPASASAAAVEENELFSGGRYRDDPEHNGYRDEAEQLDNQQVHAYHNQVLTEQDDQLDQLGESIGRQRELSMQIGDELDSHVEMLDEMESATDRQQSRLDRAGRVMGKVARRAGDNKQITTIVVLIIILVLLIAILK